ncbi:oxygen-binding di-iron domain-containing protein [Thermovibrio ammonificans]|uniref:Beta-lactamase domain protein n=1 Tax=Thermovibrio ammonificans (strain DSM 15698 / JCM 12110 / HB-1) TaxID=648996 RepID=E8T4Y6_THEA1|nr:MBL fold metallo-hydrolase [Thermovibrio ammonificans]ADU97518.1 beta-lactamase domain protein [Thermovibrio ammonificans HB-1]
MALPKKLKPNADAVLYSDSRHTVVYLGTKGAQEGSVDVLSYLVISDGEGLIVDPGGYHLFPQLVQKVCKYTSLESIKFLYFCHQDPDVCGSIPMWKEVCPQAKIAIGELWVRFLPHFGVEDIEKNAFPIPSEGATIPVGKIGVKAIPAHYLHSPNHFTLYDPISRFLFSGDIGIALGNFNYLVVEDWIKHMEFLYGPHKLLMANNKAVRAWLKRVEKLELEAILPQHGALIPKEHVKNFFKFLENLKCGTDLISL